MSVLGVLLYFLHILGNVLREERDKPYCHGFGYSPIFFSGGYDMTTPQTQKQEPFAKCLEDDDFGGRWKIVITGVEDPVGSAYKSEIWANHHRDQINFALSARLESFRAKVVEAIEKKKTAGYGPINRTLDVAIQAVKGVQP